MTDPASANERRTVRVSPAAQPRVAALAVEASNNCPGPCHAESGRVPKPSMTFAGSAMGKSLPTFRLPGFRAHHRQAALVACAGLLALCALGPASASASRATDRRRTRSPRKPALPAAHARTGAGCLGDRAGADRFGPGQADRRSPVRAQQRLEPAACRQRSARSRVANARRPFRQRGGGGGRRRHRAVRRDLRLHDAHLRRRAATSARSGWRSTPTRTALWVSSLQGASNQVPIPADARPAAGTDSQITIYQPSTDRLWEYWHFRREPDGWHARWGGAIDDVSNSPGYYSPSVVERRAVGLGRERHEPAARRGNDDAGRAALRPASITRSQSRSRIRALVWWRGPRSDRTAPAPRPSCPRAHTCG